MRVGLVVAGCALAACTSIAGLDELRFDTGGDGGAAGGGSGGAGAAAGMGGEVMCMPPFEDDIDNCGAPENMCVVRAHSVPDCEACACVNDCDLGWDDCDGDVQNGCETSTDADPLNCGGCGVDCAGAACSAGRCAVAVLATDQGEPTDIDVWGDTVFWLNRVGGEVRSCATTGCGNQPALIATTQDSAYYLSIDDTYVYWNNNGAGELYRSLHDGAMTRALLYSTPAPTRSEVDSTHLYWHSNGGTISRADKTGNSAIEVLTSNAGNSGEVKVNDTYLFWTSRSLDHVGRCEIADCENTYTVLVAGLDTARGMAIDDAHVYFGESGDGADLLARVPIDGGAMEVLTSQAAGVHMVRLTETHVYWTNEDAGTVSKMPKGGGTEDVLVTGLSGPRALAVSGDFIYVTDTGGDRIVRAQD